MTTTRSTARPTAQPSAVGLPRKFLRPLLFLSLSRAERSYGYELAEAVRSYGLNVDMAAIYRELRSMEQHNLLASEWEPSENGPDRRVYELTEDGHGKMSVALGELGTARDLLSAALEETP
jgi:PadR family transcriptional regulator PadR